MGFHSIEIDSIFLSAPEGRGLGFFKILLDPIALTKKNLITKIKKTIKLVLDKRFFMHFQRITGVITIQSSHTHTVGWAEA